MKKIFTLVAALTAFAASAQNAWNLQGNGTESDPWLISSAADFRSIAENISADNTGKGEYFIVTEDIDFGGTAEAPVQLPAIGKAAITNINTVAYGFDGVLDGNGKSIKGIYHTDNGNNDAGKFNALISSLGADGVVKNLTFAEENSVSTYNYAAPFVSLCAGKIENCVNNADITAANAFAAGICGYLINGTGTVTDCTNNGDIASMTYACGIVSGAQSGSKISDYLYSVSKCYNYGEITANTGTGASGIAGSYSGAISDCVNYGKITATKQNAAGILSAGSYAISVKDCTNEGNIVAGKLSGGIVANLMKGDDIDVTISGCTNMGAITVEEGATNIGGIVGNSQRVNGVVTLISCRNEGVISGGDNATEGNLRGNENITIGDGCSIANGLAKLPLDPDFSSSIVAPSIDNGAECTYYNLQGVRVDDTYKGIVITNGKKIIRR